MRRADEGGDELAVIDGFVLRLELGFNRVGPLDLRRDHRDWHVEADEEIADWAVYRALKRTSDRFDRTDAVEICLEEVKAAPAVDMQGVVQFDLSDLGGEG